MILFVKKINFYYMYFNLLGVIVKDYSVTPREERRHFSTWM